MHKNKVILCCLLASSSTFAQSVAAESATEKPTTLDEVTVTGTREAQALSATAATVSIIDGSTIDTTNPTHPSQIMGQVPGVWVSVTGGEGHQTAIRQPLTTSPVYLYLEDGIPTRSTGFFNHNALYEINVPQAGGIEVSKGPGSALYGSDAIGGVINTLTRPPTLQPEISITGDAGEFGFRRLLFSASNTFNAEGIRADINVTTTDGWRDATAYDRQSATLRWDSAAGNDTSIKTVFSWSDIDQQTAGTSVLSEADYYNNPTRNTTPISLRKVQALRLSTAIEHEQGDHLISVTPYLRSNEMDLLPNWSLTYDPTIYNTENKSIGVLTKYRQNFPEISARLIVGVDLDYSPGSRFEQSINSVKTGDIYSSYTTGQTLYDYDVIFQGISPYVHGEISPTSQLHFSAGLRYDNLSYAYDNKIADADIVIMPDNIAFNLTYRHPSDTDIDYTHVSPKLGVSYEFTPAISGFAAYNHAFRAPSEGQLFRQGSALNTIDLKPVKADSYEVGMRGKASADIRYEISVYSMTKEDDILNYRDPITGATQAVNAGTTLHEGIEFGLAASLTTSLQLDIAASYTEHSYKSWVVSGTADYSGKEMETAPRNMANTRLTYTPDALNGGNLSLEWVKLGNYWMDAANTEKYDGHDYLNVRLQYSVQKNLQLMASVMNLQDERYSESSSFTTSRGRQFAPGLPRTAYAGVRYTWN